MHNKCVWFLRTQSVSPVTPFFRSSHLNLVYHLANFTMRQTGVNQWIHKLLVSHPGPDSTKHHKTMAVQRQCLTCLMFFWKALILSDQMQWKKFYLCHIFPKNTIYLIFAFNKFNQKLKLAFCLYSGNL